MTGDVGTSITAITDLRQELKIWEKAFAAAVGRKADRDDIKKDATICELCNARSIHCIF